MSDIEKFREKLEYLKAQNISNLRATSENLNSLNALNQSEEAELGSVMSIAKIDENLFSARNGELAEINHALDKIKLGTYGICEMCGEAIHKERLEVKPFARFCIKCREIFENNSKRKDKR